MSFESVIDTLEIRNANKISFVGTSSSFVDTTTGRIQTKGIQHNSNVITDVSGPHGRVAPTLKKYPEIAFGASKLDRNDTTNTYVQAGYTVMASSYAAAQEPYRAFDYSGAGGGSVTWTTASITNLYGNGSGLYGTVRTSNLGLDTGGTATPQGGTRENGEWITLQIPNKITLSSITISRVDSDPTAGPKDFQLYGSNDGTTWVQILSETGADPSTTGTSYTPTSTPVAYTYFGLVVTRTISRTDYMTINDLVFYGTEENPPTGDHSVDTTFKSRFNNPQLTGVQVVVDGNAGQLGANQISGGADPSGGNQATYVTDGKYWTLNGTLTSNLSVEANTFLEGDQPHAVSVWFNSSNLEANVSNTCVFSVSDQEKLDSVNLDLQSNTWHNLTYAYQGEGGSRVAYLDGRKVLEDQAEDTFGDYPPFAMTGHSQGGYVVSASNEENSTRTAYTLFNDVESEGNGWRDTGGTFQAGTGGHYRSNGTYDPATGIPRANLGSDSGGTAFATADEGEWVKIELPYKIKLNYFTLQPRNSTSIANGSNPSLSWGRSEFIKNGKIWGSNDGINWSVVHTISGTSASNDTAINSYTVGSSVAYKYFAIVITATNTSTSYASSTSLSEWELYGHRENDLVRLPDPTNVLKYPHIAMTGPTQRGYVVTASVPSSTANYPPWKVFDNFVNTNENYWFPSTAQFTGTVDGDHSYIGGDSLDIYTGTWIKLELPYRLVISYLKFFAVNGSMLYTPRDFYVIGSNNDTTWELIHRETSTASDGTFTSGRTIVTNSANNSNNYKYIALVVDRTVNHNNLSIGEWELYGTGVDSVPIQIGGGNIDKVANFRVYDKFIGEDQVNEIWNAQKEEFGRAKPQMVLQQGKLGIGTDAPQGSLSVADEPHNLEEFPPRAIPSVGPINADNSKVYIDGHGTYEVLYSVDQPSHHNNATDNPLVLFDKTFNNLYSGINTFELNSAGATGSAVGSGNPLADPAIYTGNGSGRRSLGGYEGIWYGLKFPFKVNLSQAHIQSPANSAVTPNTAVFLGSEDGGLTWSKIGEFSGASWVAYNYNKYTLSHTKPINAAAIVITHSNHYYAANMAELKFFGTREQGQSVLHDGRLTLTKSLNVPRIGPALNADDTPRRDRLVVEYNTSTNPTFEGAVRDTSMGKKFDASIIGNAHYNATTKTFDGFGVNSPPNTTGHYFRTDISTFRGNVAHSHSVWVRMDYDNGAWNNAINLGSNTTSNQSAVAWEMGNDRLWWNTYSGGIYVSHTPQYGRWYHVVTTHNGQGATTNSTSCIYIDGVKQSTTDGTSGISGTGGTLNIAGDYLTIGAARNNSDSKIYNPFNGEIASYKLYDIVLTAEEVKDLYDMGHYEEGNNIINIEKTRVGIGLGDGVLPHEDLDVRGDIRASDNLIIGPYGQHWWKLWTYQHNGNLGFIGEDGTEHGFLVDSGTENNLDFTGQHRAVVDMVNVSDYESLEGLIVSANKNKYVNVDKDITTGLKAIQISQSLPVVSLSNVVHDKACYGVISGSEDLDSRTYEQGTFVSVFQKQKGDTRAFINSLGEGAIWVVNTNGYLESGDYITTSNIVGYGQKQDDDVLHNFTVAKITMDCDFEPATQPIQIIKKDEEGENILDEHSQIQWEDHPTETEKAYKIRYLDVSGAQTDEANAVHIAAFVGCTYHCG